MKKVRVQFVKYDMSKTKNRKRNDMLVDSQNEDAVITQLERIHKGETFVKIHELIWDEKQIKDVERLKKIESKNLFYGVIKFFENEKGFGFIEPDEEMDDLFFHKSACSEGVPFEGDRVEFKISEAPKGLIAIHVRASE